MVGELITLPFRIGVRATQLWLRAAEETVALAIGATGRLIELATARGSNGDVTARPRGEVGMVELRTAPQPTGAAASAPAPARRPSRRPSSRPEPPRPPEPVHVSSEPTLVEELAEPGAEDGVGAEVHVDPPWDGYQRMNAKQVIARLGSATPAELAAVQLYESSHRRRQTILNAVQRQLRRNGRSSQNQ